jgi:hypothetical protein
VDVFRDLVIEARKCDEIRWKYLETILDLWLSRKASFSIIKPGSTKPQAFVFSDSTLGRGTKSLPFKEYSWQLHPSVWKGLVKETVIYQQDAAKLEAMVASVQKIIDDNFGGDPANFNCVIVFVCSLNGIKNKGSRFGPWGHWENACLALQNLIQTLPKGIFVFQGPGSAELWNIPGFDVNAEQVLEYVDND